MTDDIAIRVQGLGKKYTLGGPQEHYHTLRDAIVNSVKAPFKRFHPIPPSEEFWALKDVSFDVEQGEVIGIIGRNGAGKSTLLKILSRITSPTEGTVELHGRVGSLLEVGTGFHPEMTGRENIFLNGSILGMKKAEIEQKFDEIVRFAEIDKFMDTMVKRYSSGMYIRLAFAVAAHLEPEILVVDEVLAVGDAGFQKKCLGKMGEVAKEGRTVLFVSHNMNAIKNLCPRTLLIEQGRLVSNGETQRVISDYLNEHVSSGNSILTDQINQLMTGVIRKTDPTIRFKKITLTDAKGKECNRFFSNETIELSIIYECLTCIHDLRIIINIKDESGRSILTTANSDDESEVQDMSRKQGIYETRCTFQKNLFGQKRFFISISLENPKIEHLIIDNGIFFDVTFHAYTNYINIAYENDYLRPQFSWETLSQ